MIDQKEFDRRVAYNIKLYKQQIETNEFTPSLYFLFDKKPRELKTLQYGKLFHDIYASIVCGILALSDLDEKDAMLMKGGKVMRVELKTNYITTKNVWKNSKGKVYVGYRTPLTDYMGANFSTNHDPEIPVFLVCCDTTDKWDSEVIGVWQMDGEVAISCLEKNKHFISLSKFMKQGKRKVVKVDAIGYAKWHDTMWKRLPIKQSTNLK